MRIIGRLMKIRGLAFVACTGLAASGSVLQAETPTSAASCHYPNTEYYKFNWCIYVCVLYSNSSVCYPNYKSRKSNTCSVRLINAGPWQPNAIAQVQRLQNGTLVGGGSGDGHVSLGKDLNMDCRMMPLPDDYLTHIAP